MHFFLIWHYAAPSWAKWDRLQPYGKAYVHPFFTQNFRLFAPTPVWEYHIAWKAQNENTWHSEQQTDDDLHDFWKVTSAFQRDLGRYNRLYWVQYDTWQKPDLPDTITEGYMRSQKSLKRNIWTFAKSYMDYYKKQDDLPAGQYQVRIIFENVKSRKADTLYYAIDYEAVDPK